MQKRNRYYNNNGKISITSEDYRLYGFIDKIELVDKDSDELVYTGIIYIKFKDGREYIIHRENSLDEKK